MYNQESVNNKKPTAFPLYQPHENISHNWNIDNMPWKSPATNSIMMFNGLPINQNDFPTTSSNDRSIIRKRKNEFVNPSPPKQHISESKMAAFLNGLHISNEYQAHNINLDDNSFDDEMDTYKVNLSPQELEERLKNAQKIVLCDDVKKKLEESNRNEIYQVLVDRIKPCQALVLWQPPKPLEKLITNFNFNNQKDEENEEIEEEKMILE